MYHVALVIDMGSRICFVVGNLSVLFSDILLLTSKTEIN